MGVVSAYTGLMILSRELADPQLGAVIQTTLPKLQKVLNDRGIPKNLIAFVR